MSDQSLPPLDPGRPLSEQGYTSLTAMELIQTLNQTFNLGLTTTFFFNHPTLDAMTAALRTDEAVLPKDTGFEFLDALSPQELEQFIQNEVDQL